MFPDLEDPNHLHKEFSRMFKKENFFAVFFYMEGYLDIDSSSALGRYYLQSSFFFDVGKDQY